ncbi:hypothetical protein RZS28_03700 [Methylocapsa polymorpha]|uniref:Uncharacterized protein n=1 Tax=Methylocapsa polymorpha TaxID=3080828 RepID=A0ABZ0HUB0_9HYPH|nr:hypothetical protein RZS28_03700 [Methylocapsa sp. RX1]
MEQRRAKYMFHKSRAVFRHQFSKVEFGLLGSRGGLALPKEGWLGRLPLRDDNGAGRPMAYRMGECVE